MQSRDLRLSAAGALRHAGRLDFLMSGKSCRPEFETSAQAFLLNPADEWKSIFNCVHPEALWHIRPNQKLLHDAKCCQRQLTAQPHRSQRAAADNAAFPPLQGWSIPATKEATTKQWEINSNIPKQKCQSLPTTKLNRLLACLWLIKKPSAQRDTEELEGCRRTVATKGVTSHVAVSVQYKFGGVLQGLWRWEGLKTQREGFCILQQLIDFSPCKGSERPMSRNEGAQLLLGVCSGSENNSSTCSLCISLSYWRAGNFNPK